MRLMVLGSNSLGNCYVLEADREALVIEAGCKLSEVKKALKWQLNKVVGAIVTHHHNDHAAYVKDFMAAGIRVLALESVFTEKGCSESGFKKVIEPMHGYIVGGFKIFAFPVVHDVPCVGYIIEHEEMGRTLFVTDTMALECTFPPMNHIMLEANYALDILDPKIESGRIHPAMRKRLIGSHMELETTKDILLASDLSACNEVVLIHLSNGNSDEARFVSEVKEVTGLPTYAADAGMELNFSINPY